MKAFVLRLWLLACAVLLAACGGGGDSTTVTVTGAGLNSLGLSPAVSTSFAQTSNNLRVTVEDGPHSFQLTANANVLYATVTVCVPGGNPALASDCQTIDHVQVDTGSVGLRVLASKVASLNLPKVQLSNAPVQEAWECYPFVIGGLWGANAVADIYLGQQRAPAVPMQLIQDSTSGPQPTVDCDNAADGHILSSAATLGSNGILGIGSTTLDCGLNCVLGNYSGSFVQYYSCPQGATSSGACSPTAVAANLQTFNPVAALPAGFNNGVVLKMPALPPSQLLGAATASGELILGIDSQANNQRPVDAVQVFLGVDPVHNLASYLNINTLYRSQNYAGSYLDTGTNGMFFTDTGIPKCAGADWYCPTSVINTTATLSDGDLPGRNAVAVGLQIANAEALFNTRNTAFSNVAGSPPLKPPATPGGPAVVDTSTFAWGMPFFYGKAVYLSIWQQAGSLNGPWYAWKAL